MDYSKDTVRHMDERDVRIANLEAELNRIYNSHGWKALALYYKVGKIFFQQIVRGERWQKAYGMCFVS